MYSYHPTKRVAKEDGMAIQQGPMPTSLHCLKEKHIQIRHPWAGWGRPGSRATVICYQPALPHLTGTTESSQSYNHPKVSRSIKTSHQVRSRFKPMNACNLTCIILLDCSRSFEREKFLHSTEEEGNEEEKRAENPFGLCGWGWGGGTSNIQRYSSKSHTRIVH